MLDRRLSCTEEVVSCQSGAEWLHVRILDFEVSPTNILFSSSLIFHFQLYRLTSYRKWKLPRALSIQLETDTNNWQLATSYE